MPVVTVATTIIINSFMATFLRVSVKTERRNGFARLRSAHAALLVMVSLFTVLSAAQSQLEHKADHASESPEAHVGRGYDALKDDNFTVAASEFRSALKLDPKLTLRARFPLGVALFEMKQLDEARTEFETVRDEFSDYPSASYYLGRIDIDEQHYDSAIANFNSVIAAPPFADTAYYLGFACFKNGDLASAEKWLKEAEKATPQDSRVSYQLGLVYQKLGRQDEAKKAIATSSEQRRGDLNETQLRFECGKKLDQGTREEAHALCDQLYDPNNAAKLTQLGAIYGQHGDVEAALKPLQRAAELQPRSPQMQYNLALAYYQLNRFGEARAALDGAVSRWPDIFPLASLYGAVLAKLGEDRLAYQALKSAHAIKPEDAATSDLLFLTTLSLARKAQASRKYPDALEYFQESAKLKPQEPSPHRGLAELYKLTGHSADAKRELAEAARLANAFEASH